MENHHAETLEGDPTGLRESGSTKAKKGIAAKTPEDGLTDHLEGDA